jgi:hypothetical protein
MLKVNNYKQNIKQSNGYGNIVFVLLCQCWVRLHGSLNLYETSVLVLLCQCWVRLHGSLNLYETSVLVLLCQCWVRLHGSLNLYETSVSHDGLVLGLWCLTPLSTIFQLYRGSQFYWWRKPEYWRKPLTCRMSLTNFITWCCIKVGFELTTLSVTHGKYNIIYVRDD